MTTKASVAHVLHKFPDTAKNDRLLIWAVWYFEINGTYSGVFEREIPVHITLGEFEKLTPAATILRAKREILSPVVKFAPIGVYHEERKAPGCNLFAWLSNLS